jgi:hypothetical protein
LLTDEHGETRIFYKMDTEEAERRKRRIFLLTDEHGETRMKRSMLKEEKFGKICSSTLILT